MSVESCQAFLRVASDSPELNQQLKAMTSPRELVRLGRRHGYVFGVCDLQAPPAGGDDDASPTAAPPTAPADTEFLHHEYRLEELRGFDGVIEQLPHLMIKPDSVDLDRFADEFRKDDLRTLIRSPADPEYRSWHAAMFRAGWRDPSLGPEAPRRDFHLVNLDDHVDHPGYGRYLTAKRRTIDALEALFDAEIRFSGSLWYPPGGYRLWHTNATQPGWRMYVIDFDEPPAGPDDRSFFRYMDPRTEKIVTLGESRRRIVRIFKVEQEPSRLFWHCIANPTARHRWSFGFAVPDDWMDHVRRKA